ncbi:MAG TPA: hypothetical protein VLD39_01020, partial [Gammaproteobacteria bacterium]|nr:hypothetical protein [Gammaproteobacteria bacterium]
MGGVADADIEAALARSDGQPLISELADDVERFARLLFEREAQRIRRDLLLDRLAHVRRGAEEAIRRHQSLEGLMRPLKIVVSEVVLEPSLRVDEVREDRAPEKLVPQRLPEALDLAERLRVLWPTANVGDAMSRQRLLEFGATAPHRVLPTVVGE